MISVGLVGAGPWAEILHAPMLAGAPDLQLSAIWARRPEAAQGLAQRFATVAVGSFEELLDRCDAVAFAVPPNVQASLAPVAAKAGKHLLLEKPLAFTVAEAERIAQASDEAGVITQLLLTYRFTRTVRDFLDTARESTVRQVRTGWISDVVGSPFATPWRLAPGAALLDVGPHALDLLSAIAGPVEWLLAAQTGGVTAITTSHGGGAIGQSALSVTTPGTSGPLEAEVVTDTGRTTLADPTPYDPALVMATIAADFAGAVRGELLQPLDVHHGLELQRLIAAVQRSIAAGRPVETPELADRIGPGRA
jgi:predicted dehydrogenase